MEFWVFMGSPTVVDCGVFCAFFVRRFNQSSLVMSLEEGSSSTSISFQHLLRI
jgi:hypothetical protein